MKIFGANWQTTVSGLGGYLMAFITWLSTISYDQGPISMVIPVAYKKYVTWAAAFCALILLAWNAIQQKSKNVTGGMVQQTANGDVAVAGSLRLVDDTIKASIASNDPTITDEQKRKANS